MFKAFVLVCVMLTPDNEQCIIFEDTWGPYITIENCTIRSNQIRIEIYQELSTLYPVTTIDTECIDYGEML